MDQHCAFMVFRWHMLKEGDSVVGIIFLRKCMILAQKLGFKKATHQALPGGVWPPLLNFEHYESTHSRKLQWLKTTVSFQAMALSHCLRSLLCYFSPLTALAPQGVKLGHSVFAIHVFTRCSLQSLTAAFYGSSPPPETLLQCLEKAVSSTMWLKPCGLKRDISTLGRQTGCQKCL